MMGPPMMGKKMGTKTVRRRRNWGLAEVGAEELAAEEDGVEVEELLADDTGAEGDAETRASAMKMMVPMMRKKKKMMMTMMMMGNLLAEVGAEELAAEED